MFSFLVGLLTVVLVLDCLFLLLLILIQLPKKEAGLGQAFGSSTTDALFGAGSGTALTKVTKYAAGVFFALTFLLAIMNTQMSKERRGGRLQEAIEKAKAAAAAQPAPAPAQGTNAPIKVTPPALNLTSALPAAATAASNAASAVATNKPPATPATK
ncbi:MAG: preprotein translocase subunit SecG [Verrucomicrobia bacterium]|nr:preprotein translocase subunit SecG [Verrucomicrobiota bacterium]